MHDTGEIVKLRPQRNLVNADMPYHFLQEQEPGPSGAIQRVNTIFLTGKECAFKCLMCDLWKNTLTGPTPAGAIPKQIDYALARLPEADVIKLYNSSNFFDQKAVPPADYAAIIERLQPYGRVIVENHPKLCDEACLEFKDQLNGTLEIAMGLESIHPAVLPKLNKQMTAEDFSRAAKFLRSNWIDVRAFILLNPPYLTDKAENIRSVQKAVEFAFENGVQCCSIIPTRPGNGVMELLQAEGHYVPPTLEALEDVFDNALGLNGGRVFVDTWDIAFLADCLVCFEARKNRLNAMNMDQKIHPRIVCTCTVNDA